VELKGFLKVQVDGGPDGFQGGGLGVKDPLVSFFPELPHYEAW
jgi:hypothetical protein